MNIRAPLFAASLTCCVCAAADQAPSPPPAAKTPACTSEPHRQFDFWVGEWSVTVNGKQAGENRIEKILDGCALQENWTGVGGLAGESLNFYDEARKVWHQTWISDQGGPLYLEGGFQDGKMVLSGEVTDPKSKTVTRHRITWTPLPGGDVRQFWDSSSDEGKTWAVQFDGLYKRKG